MEANYGLEMADLAQGCLFPLLSVPFGQFVVAVTAHENRIIPTGMGVRPFIAAYFAGFRSHSPKSCGLGPPDRCGSNPIGISVLARSYPDSLCNVFSCINLGNISR